MSMKTRKEYTASVRKRYVKADRKEKIKILDEFCNTCGYHRKYAIRLLNKKASTRRKKPPGRKREYTDPLLLKTLLVLWKKLNLPCSKRLKAAIPLWLPYYEDHTGRVLPEKIKKQLIKMSPATIDRLMAPLRLNYSKLGLSTTKPGSILKTHIPIKTNQWNERRPGFLEADTVAHCGTSTAGTYIYTVNTVDIATGWTEQRAIWGKGYMGVHGALIHIEKDLPFPILGLDCDNGSEFLNWHIHKHFCKRRRPVHFTRSRPYQKNDNAHIEEKNWSIIRQYIGYNRLDQVEWTQQLNDIYTSEWRLLMNYFRPSSKLQSKQREEGRVIKRYDSPKTPYQRLMESDRISDDVKEQLTIEFQLLNPFELQQKMEIKIKHFLKQTEPVFQKYSVADKP